MSDREALIERVAQHVVDSRGIYPEQDAIDAARDILDLLESEGRLVEPLEVTPGFGEHLVEYQWFARDTRRWTPLVLMSETEARAAVQSSEPGSMVLVRRAVDIGPWLEVQ